MAVNNLPLVLFVIGPTGVGKSKLAIKIAHKFNGEIISADSIQVFKKFNIGSAKVTKIEMEAIPHHLVSHLDPLAQFDIKIFQDKANKLIKTIIKKGKLPIICGGSALYLAALMYNYNLQVPCRNSAFEKKLLKKSNKELFNMLSALDPIACLNIHTNNRSRVLRSLDLALNQKIFKSQMVVKSWLYKPLIIAIKTKNREILYNLINKRVDQMMLAGLTNEVKILMIKYPNSKALNSIGYREICLYLNGKHSQKKAIEQIKIHSRNLAKHQLTWFNNKFNCNWFYLDKKNYLNYSKIFKFIKNEMLFHL